MSKYSIDEVRKIFDEFGYDLIDDKYINNRTELRYICRKHPSKGIQKIKLSNLLNGSGCVYCRYEKGLSIGGTWPDDIIIDALDKIGCDFVNKYYQNHNVRIQFICRKHPWKGVQETNWTAIREGQLICKVCNGNDRTTEDFKRMMQDINPNIEIIGEYKGARERILCRCKIDGFEWEPYVYNLLSGYGCPKCGHTFSGESRRISQKDKIDKLQMYHNDIDFLSAPILSTDYVHCRCKKCGCEWWATYSNLSKSDRSTGCPRCTTSLSEKQIISILNKWNLNFTTQYTYDDCKDINKLPFDFYLLDFNVLIEFDGEHHYRPIYRYKNDPDGSRAKIEFEITVKHDNIKSDYCFNNNIPLIRIPYWYREDLEYYLFDKFVENKVIVLS